MVEEKWYLNARLFLVLDRECAQPRSLEEVTEKAVDAGVEAVVLRMLDAGYMEILRTARKIKTICKARGAPFILSHNPQMAQLLIPDAVHLGKRDLPIPDVKRIVPRQTAIGYSAHSVEEAEKAVADGADYFFLGPIFYTPSKAKYGAPLGLDILRKIPSHIFPRAVFIGGINEDTLPKLVEFGGRRIAVIRAIQSADDIAYAVRKLKDLLYQEES